MRILRYMAPSLCTLFSLYCIIWGLFSPSSSITYRIDAVFFGGLLLLLAFVHLRVLPSPQRQEIVLLKQDG